MSELLELERAIGERDVARVVALARRFDEGAEPAIDDPAREKLLFDLADWLWSAGEPKAALEVMALALDLASRNGALDPVATARRLDRLADRLEATGQLTLAADVWKRAITLTETVEAGAAPVWRLQRYVRVLRGIGAPTSQIEEAEHALARLQHREPGAEPMMPPASPIIVAPARSVPQPLPQPVPQSAPPPASPGAFRRAGPPPPASPQSRPSVSPPASPIPDFGMAREEGRKPSGLRQRLDRKRAESDAFQAPELEAVFDDVAAPAALVDEAQAYHRVPVHFMTHRGLGDRANPYATFSDAPPPTQVLHFGIAHVTVPLKRDVGALPVQGWLASRLFDPDPAVYLTIRSIDLLSHGVFFDTLRTRIAYSRRKEALVFVHGFNTTFTEALFRVAQLAVDLEIDGAPILYSWPSRGSVFGYVADREQSRNVELHRDFERFLMEISERTGATHIHLVGHSMGAQMLLSTLDRLHDTLPKPPVRRFDEIVFAAPDVARDQFTAAVRRVAPLGRRTTVYASRSDIPLTLSGILAGGGRSGDRTGVDAAALAGLREVECIDTTLAPDDFLAHGAFASRAIDDLQGVLWLSLDPTRRKRLIRRQAPDGVYWIYDPMKDTNAFTRAIAFVRRHGVAGALDHVARLIDARRRQAAPESEMALHLAVQSELDQLRSVLT